MKYFYSYTNYHDCPSCDGDSGDDADFCYISELFDNKYALIKDIEERIGHIKYFYIASVGPYGEITILTEVFESTGGHKVTQVKFELEGFTYSFDFNKDSKNYYKLTTNDEGFKLLYGNE